MTPIPCTFFEALPLLRLYLRRYIMDGNCPHPFPDGYKRCCNAMAPLDDIPIVHDGRGCLIIGGHHHPPHDDPRWPKQCEACGAEFLPAHQWQVHPDHLYRSKATPAGEIPVEESVICALRSLPVGALWYQDFGIGQHSRPLLTRKGRPELFGRPPARELKLPHLCVRTPSGVADLDTVATNGDGWELTGEPPRVTASPSIQHHDNGWHGYLRDGVLTEC